MCWDQLVELASSVFTGATILIGIELLFLSQTWKNYQALSKGWPCAEDCTPQGNLLRGFRAKLCNRRCIPESDLLKCLLAGCCLLGISILLNIVSLLGVVGIMLRIPLFWYQVENLYQARYFLFVGCFLFICGVFIIGFVRFYEGLHWCRDKTTPLVFRPTESREDSTTDDNEV